MDRSNRRPAPWAPFWLNLRRLRARWSTPIAALLCVPALAWLTFASWKQQFVCDDAYISFRYARNLLEGRGLTFNPGEWVEGYTNFLWVLEVAALWALGVPPVTGALWLSAIATAGTVGVTAAWARRSDRPNAAMAIAVVLLATERSVAVWASGGLATRQFTGLVVAALLAWTLPGARAAGAGSLLWGLAALTRPEAYLLAPLSGLPTLFDRWRGGTLDRTTLAALFGPGGALVGGHLAWRLWAYGEWLPNTYTAKHVGTWFEMGGRYLFAASVEAGLYLVVPLALLGVAARVRRTGRWAEASGLLCIAAYVPFLVRIGGDHFEWRPLDWWWPILFVGAADGVLTLARAAARRWPRADPWLAVPLTLAVLLYGRVLEASHDVVVWTKWAQDRHPALHVEITTRRSPWVWAAPGVSLLLPAYNEHLAWAIDHGGAIRQARHRSFARGQLRYYGPYLAVRDALDWPEGSAAVRGSVGIMPFHLPDLVVIDSLGLTDATVARHPVPDRKQRHLAHDRRPPKGYLKSRNAFLRVRPATDDVREALRHVGHAWVLSDTMVVPFDSIADGGWAARAFTERTVWRRTLHAGRADQNTLFLDGVSFRGERFLGRFDKGMDGWTSPGLDRPRHGRVGDQDPVENRVGKGMLNTYGRTDGDGATGLVRSRPVRVPPRAALAFLVGGGSGPRVGVRVLVDGGVVATEHGRRSTHLQYVWVDLAAHRGGQLQVEVFDDGTDPWDHVLADHFVLLTAQP